MNYKEVMLDFETKRFLSKPDLAMSLFEASHWRGGHNSWLTFVGISAITGYTADSIYNVYIVQILWK